MGGLEKIRENIMAEAEKEIGAIKEKAAVEIAEINLRHKKDCEKLTAENVEKTQSECMRLSTSIVAEAEAEARDMILSEKNKIIKDACDEIKKYILNSREYFEFLGKLLENNAEDGEGIIYFSEKDVRAMPADFKKKLSEKKLTISSKSPDISGGFIIRYDKIDINCSIDAIFEDKKNALADIIGRFI